MEESVPIAREGWHACVFKLKDTSIGTDYGSAVARVLQGRGEKCVWVK